MKKIMKYLSSVILLSTCSINVAFADYIYDFRNNNLFLHGEFTVDSSGIADFSNTTAIDPAAILDTSTPGQISLSGAKVKFSSPGSYFSEYEFSFTLTSADNQTPGDPSWQLSTPDFSSNLIDEDLPTDPQALSRHNAKVQVGLIAARNDFRQGARFSRFQNVSAVPVPPALPLMATSLIAFGITRRRKNP